MERIRQRLLDESASIKRGEEKRKEREGKKYGKQVQIEKMKERERAKKEMEERLKGLKRSAIHFIFLIHSLFSIYDKNLTGLRLVCDIQNTKTRSKQEQKTTKPST